MDKRRRIRKEILWCEMVPDGTMAFLCRFRSRAGHTDGRILSLFLSLYKNRERGGKIQFAVRNKLVHFATNEVHQLFQRPR